MAVYTRQVVVRCQAKDAGLRQRQRICKASNSRRDRSETVGCK